MKRGRRCEPLHPAPRLHPPRFPRLTFLDLPDSTCGRRAHAGLRGHGKVNGTVQDTYEIIAVDAGRAADRIDHPMVKVRIYDNSGEPAPMTGVLYVNG
ncbi:hypothetical protein GCM10009525_64930 [Streptosporangium amethystogenes subsp. fukuiense]